jgi:hypothetical protein
MRLSSHFVSEIQYPSPCVGVSYIAFSRLEMQLGFTILVSQAQQDCTP